MKVFSFVFLIYIFTLSLQPCSELFVTRDDCSPNAIEQTHIHSPHQKDADSPECSPFCVCSCVPGSITYRLTFLENVQIPTMITSATNPVHYTSQFTNFFSNSIWQPPKA